MKTPERRRRDTAMTYAREYAKDKDVLKTQRWLERAEASFPITEIQLWRIKTLLGPERFMQLNLSVISGAKDWPFLVPPAPMPFDPEGSNRLGF